MKRFDGSHRVPATLPHPVVALGNFDGVHRAHQTLIEHTRAIARKLKGTSVVYTFHPHPAAILAPDAAPLLLQTLDQRLETFEACGIDATVVEPFTTEFAAKRALDFFENIIVGRLHAAALVVGYDFTFGHKREGTVKELEAWARKHGLQSDILPAQFSGEELISSTQIRRLIAAGGVQHAALLLGRAHELVGTVIPGHGRGKGLGAPTANINPNTMLIPGDGVYVTTTLLPNGKKVNSITNVGTNPTFGDDVRMVETHLLEGGENVVGTTIRVAFLERLRDEKTFKNPQELAAQIARDIEEARRRHGRRAS